MRISISMLFEFICMVNARFALLQFANYRWVRAADSVVICELSKKKPANHRPVRNGIRKLPVRKFAVYPRPFATAGRYQPNRHMAHHNDQTVMINWRHSPVSTPNFQLHHRYSSKLVIYVLLLNHDF